MFAKLFARIGGGLAANPGLCRRLLRLVRREGGLLLDAPTLAGLGATLEQARRAAYALASRECVHLLAEPDGSVAVLSNPQFKQITRIRLSLPAANQAPNLVPEKSRRPLRKPAGGDPADAAREYAWFTLKVAPTGRAGADGRVRTPERRKIPIRRQEMPNRRREPWMIFDGVGLETE